MGREVAASRWWRGVEWACRGEAGRSEFGIPSPLTNRGNS